MKKKFRSIFFLSITAIISIIGFNSCKTTSAMNNAKNYTYFLSYSIDGKKQLFTDNALATFEFMQLANIHPISYHIINLNAGNSADSITFSIHLQTKVPVDTLTEYNLEKNGIILSVTTIENDSLLTSDSLNNPGIKLNFTSIGNDYVKGKFSGTVADKQTGSEKTLTNGEFYLPKKQ